MEQTQRGRPAGFTLLELLVAIAIFALMYVLAQQFFSHLLEARSKLDARAATLEERQRTLLTLTHDLEQLVMRPVRDRLGMPEPALMGVPEGIEFTRLGWSNPFGLQPRSNMQRVRYALHDGQLVRRYWPALDANVGTRPVDDVLLNQVDTVQFRFLVNDGQTGEWQWVDRWPDAGTEALPLLLQPFPKSVELTVTLENGETLHRFFRLVANPWVAEQ